VVQGQAEGEALPKLCLTPSLQALFENPVLEVPAAGNVIIEEVEKCEGEARANNRKGKLIFFYEWNLTLKWKGMC
jgi:hypothetical protein